MKNNKTTLKTRYGLPYISSSTLTQLTDFFELHNSRSDAVFPVPVFTLNFTLFVALCVLRIYLVTCLHNRDIDW